MELSTREPDGDFEGPSDDTAPGFEAEDWPDDWDDDEPAPAELQRRDDEWGLDADDEPVPEYGDFWFDPEGDDE